MHLTHALFIGPSLEPACQPFINSLSGSKVELWLIYQFHHIIIFREPDIPKDSDITYTLELIDVKPPIDLTVLPYNDRLQMG